MMLFCLIQLNALDIYSLRNINTEAELLPDVW